MEAMVQQMVQQQVDQNLLSMAEMIEDQVDDQLKRLENLDDDDLEKIRQRRMDEMKRMQKRREKWLQQGHGEYQDLSDEKVRTRAVACRQVRRGSTSSCGGSRTLYGRANASALRLLSSTLTLSYAARCCSSAAGGGRGRRRTPRASAL
jgi:hypothetical protein